MASWLRSFEEGKLKVSAGNLLPYNTFSGEYDGEIDPNAPHMDNPTGISDKFFVAGDARANENSLLVTMHTIFVREHNRLCDTLIVLHPDWNDEQLYQHARKLVGGLIQSVLYNEWLPAMGVDLPAYEGYDETVNPGISNVFTAAAYRLGHTLLSPNILRLNENREPLEAGPVGLREAFFNPEVIRETGGLDPFIRGMGVQVHQQFDAKIVDDVRNFLFGAPGAGGLDLASININRGRERGLPDFNSVRAAFGLPKYRHLAQINADLEIYARVLVLYNSPNWVDPWVGMLIEEPMPNALFGETLMEIMKAQFGALRDGDRFFYLNDPVLTEEEKNWIHTTKLSEILVRNSGVERMQLNVFKAGLPEDCDQMDMEIVVMNEDGTPIPGVTTMLTMENGPGTAINTDEEGTTNFEEVLSCAVVALAINKNDAYTNGLTTLDIIMLQKHILGITPLKTPYEMLAGDVNLSGSLTTLDIIKMRKVILGVDNDFEGLSVWRFVPADYSFADPSHPFEQDMPENLMSFDNVPNEKYEFVAIKSGDINRSARLDPEASRVETRNLNTVVLSGVDQSIIPGETTEIELSMTDFNSISGFQFGLAYNQEALTFIGFESKNIPNLNADHIAVFEDQGMLTSSWNAQGDEMPKEGQFVLKFIGNREGQVSEFLQLSNRITPGEVYDVDYGAHPINLVFETPAVGFASSGLSVKQNHPNPFKGQTSIQFNLPQKDQVSIRVFDVSGKNLYEREATFGRGWNEMTIDQSEIGVTGTVFYEITTSNSSETKSMIILD